MLNGNFAPSEMNSSPDKGGRGSRQYMSSARKTRKSVMNRIDSDGARV